MLFCSFVVVLSACNTPETSLSNLPGNSTAPEGGSRPIVVAAPTPVLSATPVTSLPDPVSSKTIALVYDGPGACEDGCAVASADTAKLAGFTPKIIGPNELTDISTPAEIEALFKDVAIWIQPGGKSTKAMAAISSTLRSAMIDFIKNGGGYVGFCAGAFITTEYIGSTGVKGFGIFPGATAPLGTNTLLETVKWEGKTRAIYFEGGPYMYNMPSSVEVTALYDDGKTIASARTSYGSGRVYITGPHPEAPSWWGSLGSDGSDRDLAIGMMKWAAKQI